MVFFLHFCPKFPSHCTRTLWPGFYEQIREMWVRGGWILMFAAYHAVQCAAKCDVTAMRVSFCGMDAYAARPARSLSLSHPPLARNINPRASSCRGGNTLRALGCTSKCHSKLHALLCPDCILILSHQCGLGSREEGGRESPLLYYLWWILVFSNWFSLCFLLLFCTTENRFSFKTCTKIQWFSFFNFGLWLSLNIWKRAHFFLKFNYSSMQFIIKL